MRRRLPMIGERRSILSIGTAQVYGSGMHKIIAMVPIALAVALVAGCGASSAELKAAHDTTYKAPPATLFAAAKQATEANSQVKVTDPDGLRIVTQPQWYTPDGQLDTTTGENISRLQEDSINLAFTVQLTKTDGDAYKLVVTPTIGRKHGLTSLPETVDPSDPSLPGWVAGKTNALEMHVYDGLKPYATATPGAAGAPAATPTPAPAAAPTAPAAPAAPAPEPAAPAPAP